MIPYIILWLAFFGVLSIVEGTRLSDWNKLDLFGTLFGFQYWIGTIKWLSHTWFISYIMLFYLITPLLQNIKIENAKKGLISFICVSILLQLFAVYRVISLEISYVMLYLFGYFFRRIEENIKSENKVIIFFVIITVITLPIRILIQYFDNARLIELFAYFRIPVDVVLSWHHALMGISIFLILKKVLKKSKNNWLSGLSDKFSYYIYLTHQIFILNSFSLLHITNNLGLNILFIIGATIISAVALFGVTKIVNWIIEKIKKCMPKMKNSEVG